MKYYQSFTTVLGTKTQLWELMCRHYESVLTLLVKGVWPHMETLGIVKQTYSLFVIWLLKYLYFDATAT